MGRNSDMILVIVDQGPGQVPHGVQWSGRGVAGEGQPMSMVNVQLKLSTKFVRFSFVGKKKSNFKSSLLDDTLQEYNMNIY